MGERTLLHALVRQRNWTYSAFSRAYQNAAAAVAREEGDPQISRATVAEQTYRRWTNGRVKSLPNWPANRVLEHLLGYPASQLFSPPDETQQEESSRGCTIDENELLMTAHDAAGHAREAASHAVSDLTVEQLEDDVRSVARQYHNVSPAETHQRGAELMETTRSILDRTQRTRQRERLYFTAGQCSALLASVSFDLGSLDSATKLARTAALYGEVIDHGPLQGYSRGVLAYLAYWDGRPSEAVRLVREAQQFPGLGDTARIRLAVIEARAHAHLSDTASAARTIQSIEGYASGVRDDLHDDIGGEFGMPADRTSMPNATTYLLINQPRSAEQAATRALELLAANPPAHQATSTRAKASVELARARLMRRDLDGANAALDDVLQLPAQWRTSGLLERVTALRGDLTRAGMKDAALARDLGNRIEEYTALSSVRQISQASRLKLE